MSDSHSPASPADTASKVATVTLGFWIMKICATTVGETGGDLLSMTMDVGYATSSLILISIFLLTLLAQLRARRFNPFLYWAVILSTSTAGTTISDYMDRTLQLGYATGAAILVTILVAVLLAWRLAMGAIAVDHIRDRRVETFYWMAILASNTLGHGAGRFSRRQFRSRVWPQQSPDRERHRAHHLGLLLHTDLAHRPVLGGLRPDAPLRRNDGRPPDQVAREGRFRPRHNWFDHRASGSSRRPDPVDQPAPAKVCADLYAQPIRRDIRERSHHLRRRRHDFSGLEVQRDGHRLARAIRLAGPRIDDPVNERVRLLLLEAPP